MVHMGLMVDVCACPFMQDKKRALSSLGGKCRLKMLARSVPGTLLLGAIQEYVRVFYDRRVGM